MYICICIYIYVVLVLFIFLFILLHLLLLLHRILIFEAICVEWSSLMATPFDITLLEGPKPQRRSDSECRMGCRMGL